MQKILPLLTDTRLEETLVGHTLDCGLTILVAPRPGFHTFFADYVLRFGSIHNEWMQPSGKIRRYPDGIAHFLEHEMFKKESGDLSDEFTRLGAYSNAHTTNTSTSYYFETVSNPLENLRILLRMCTQDWFTPELVEIEREIIIQEIVSYRDNPFWVNYQQYLSSLYAKHPVRIDILGDEESVSAITPKHLKDCHKRFYHPSNACLIVSGDVDPQQIIDVACEELHHFRPIAEASRPEHVTYAEPMMPKKSRTHFVMATSTPHLVMGTKAEGVKDPAKLEQKCHACDILLDIAFGTGGDLIEKLYDEQMVAGDFSTNWHGEKDFFYYSVGGRTTSPDKLESRLRKRMQEIRAKGVSKAAVERRKRRALGRFIKSFNSPERTAFHHEQAWLNGLDPFTERDLIASITVEDVERVAEELFDEERLCVSTVASRT